MNSSDGAIIPVLVLFTLLVFLALGVWQYRRARKARQEHHHSTVGDTPTPREPAAVDKQRGERIG